MKNKHSFLLIGGIAALGAWLLLGEKPVLSYPMAITNTPAIQSPTPLPTEVLTAVPTLQPTVAVTRIVTAIPTLRPTTPAVSTPPAATATPPPSALPVLGNGEAVGKAPVAGSMRQIVIPALFLDSPIYPLARLGDQWDLSSLGTHVGWLEESSQPTMGGNTVLVGHLDLRGGIFGPFHNLSALRPQDEIWLYTVNQIFKYHVSSSWVTQADDLSVLVDSDDSQITLITCSPDSWDVTRQVYALRQVVVAKLVSSSPIAIDPRR